MKKAQKTGLLFSFLSPFFMIFIFHHLLSILLFEYYPASLRTNSSETLLIYSASQAGFKKFLKMMCEPTRQPPPQIGIYEHPLQSRRHRSAIINSCLPTKPAHLNKFPAGSIT